MISPGNSHVWTQALSIELDSELDELPKALGLRLQDLDNRN
jgi:hypothetical protein